MSKQATKWITSHSPAGKPRNFDRIAIFAMANAIAEGLPFTCLASASPTGRSITHNYKESVSLL